MDKMKEIRSSGSARRIGKFSEFGERTSKAGTYRSVRNVRNVREFGKGSMTQPTVPEMSRGRDG